MRKGRTNIYIVTVLLLLVIASLCLSGAAQDPGFPFYLEVSSGEHTEKVYSWKIKGNRYGLTIPGYTDLERSRIILRSDEQVSIGGILLENEMFADGFEPDTEYQVLHQFRGEQRVYTITFFQSGGVDTMYLNTRSGNMNFVHETKENKEICSIRLYSQDGNLNYYGPLDNIGGHGNSTWQYYPKKSYNINLAREADLLGMGTAQNWTLLADALDVSCLKNKIVYDFAHTIGMPFSPESRWVELYLNGNYRGLYLLCEKNEVHPERVDIQGDNSFLVNLEVESRLQEQSLPYVTTESGRALRIRYPKIPNIEELADLQQTWQSVENAIFSETDTDPVTQKTWMEQIDLDSWVKKYLIEETFGNFDACFISQFFYRDGNGLIYAGPVWDFDNSMGIGGELVWQLENPCSFLANRPELREGITTPWFYHLYQKPLFYNRLVEIYQSEFLPALEELLDEKIWAYSAQIESAARIDRTMWVWDDIDMNEDKTERIYAYLTERINCLNRIWLEADPYHIVRVDQNRGKNYAYYVVFQGETLRNLPQCEDTDTHYFRGWYYLDSDKPFDPETPIMEDIKIYVKWEIKPKPIQNTPAVAEPDVPQLLTLGEFGKWIPLAVVVVALIIMAVEDIKKNQHRR